MIVDHFLLYPSLSMDLKMLTYTLWKIKTRCKHILVRSLSDAMVVLGVFFLMKRLTPLTLYILFYFL